MSMPECSVVVDAAVSVAGATAVSLLLLPQAARPAMRTAASEVAAAVRVGRRIRKILWWEARFSRRTRLRARRTAAALTDPRSRDCCQCALLGSTAPYSAARPGWTGRTGEEFPSALRAPAAREAVDHVHRDVDLLVGVVERQRGPHRRLHTEAAQDRLGAVVPGAYRDALAVEFAAHLFGAEPVEHERHDAGLLRRRPDQAQPGDLPQAGGEVLDQGVLVGRDVRHAEALDVVQRGGQADRVGDVPGTGLEPSRRRLVERAFQGHVGDHVAAALPRRHVGEGLPGAV